MLIWLLACGDEPESAAADDGFAKATDVRLVQPEAGAVVAPTFTVVYEAGADLRRVHLELDGTALTDPVEATELGRLDVTAPSGRHTLSLIGSDRTGTELSRDEREIRVISDEESEWVAITTPSDGAHPVNPVTFVVDGSAGVVEVELFADDWSLGTTTSGSPLSYTFSGVGFSREIEAIGRDSAGEDVALDAITITVEAGTDGGPADFNEVVLDLVDSYPQDGSFEYYWPQSGSWSGGTRDVWYQDELVGSGGGYSACYCSGITWEVYLRAWQEWAAQNGEDADDLNGVSADDIWDMRRDWYVRDLYGPGPSVAMENYGVGTEVTSFDDWEPGDFVQFWRTSGSGHTAVFMGWVTDDDGNRLGMDYVSCQGSTDGYSINDEYFGSHSGALDPANMYAGRGWLPELWY
ncbi:MAG: hypothetical protein GY913_07480 [Proteobacteria bacterium]|nr:hypothetical protein [Pseudomonadota bacterium]MCP4916751.1 hypothetical protein [Pseudomonadota bacterium]